MRRFYACLVVVTVIASTVVFGQRLATDADRLTAQLEIAKDGRSLTVRGPAPDSLRLCVEPAAGKFAPKRCFTVGDIRAGRVVTK